MSATSTHPTLREELARKAIDAIFAVLEQHTAKTISTEAARVALNAIFTTVSGLVPWDVLDIVDKAQREFAA